MSSVYQEIQYYVYHIDKKNLIFCRQYYKFYLSKNVTTVKTCKILSIL